MPRDPGKYLFDMNLAAERLWRFTDGIRFADYEADEMLRAAVERQFGIIGEALSQLARVAPEIAEGIHSHRKIISFRNILIHGYATIDDKLVWGIVESELDQLQTDLRHLLNRREHL